VLQTPQEQEKLFAKSDVPSAATERLRKALVEKEAKIAWEMNSTGRVPRHPPAIECTQRHDLPSYYRK
jgi:hypothetical protein